MMDYVNFHATSKGEIIVTPTQYPFAAILQNFSSPTCEISYCPNSLIDALREYLDVKNDAALARRLRVYPSIISKVRSRKLPVTAALLISMHEESDLSIRDLRWLLGDKRRYFKQFILKNGQIVF